MQLRFLLLFLLLSSCSIKKNNYQNYNIEDLEYDFFNNNIISIFEVKDEKVKLFLNEKPLAISESLKSIFSIEKFNEYLNPTLGVEYEKIRELTRVLDFKYLSNYVVSRSEWNQKRISKNVILINNDKIRYEKKGNSAIFLITKPIFNKEKNIAFVVFTSKSFSGNFYEGVYLKVFKLKKKNKWLFFTKIPLTL